MKNVLKSLIPQKLINLLWHKPLAIFASYWYGFPGKKLTVIGIAGTKGKTSTAYILSHILDTAKIPNVLICTAAFKVKGEEKPNPLKMTSPDVFFVNRFLRGALQKGCTHAILEVSSHAIDQYRVWGIPFSLVLLTNLEPDHLEYHANAFEYQSIHKKIISSRHTILLVNAEDQYTKKFRSTPKEKIYITTDGIAAQLVEGIDSFFLKSFQKKNAIASAAAALVLGVSVEIIRKALGRISSIPGRFEHIQEGQPFAVIVDYAHSPLSLKIFFDSLAGQRFSSIITVFGACGERDASQRPLMGELLDQYSHIIIVTNDDPYSEDEKKIAQEVISGIRHKEFNNTLYRILDRGAAIKKAFTLAPPNSAVCILGKGAEQFQVFANKKIPWDDRAVARELLRKPM